MSEASAPLPSSVFKERPIGEALDELKRELAVRDRCYPGWVRDGKLARTDARDRYDRLKSAVLLIEREHPEAGADTENGDGPY